MALTCLPSELLDHIISFAHDDLASVGNLALTCTYLHGVLEPKSKHRLESLRFDLGHPNARPELYGFLLNILYCPWLARLPQFLHLNTCAVWRPVPVTYVSFTGMEHGNHRGPFSKVLRQALISVGVSSKGEDEYISNDIKIWLGAIDRQNVDACMGLLLLLLPYIASLDCSNTDTIFINLAATHATSLANPRSLTKLQNLTLSHREASFPCRVQSLALFLALPSLRSITSSLITEDGTEHFCPSRELVTLITSATFSGSKISAQSFSYLFARAPNLSYLSLSSAGGDTKLYRHDDVVFDVWEMNRALRPLRHCLKYLRLLVGDNRVIEYRRQDPGCSINMSQFSKLRSLEITWDLLNVRDETPGGLAGLLPRSLESLVVHLDRRAIDAVAARVGELVRRKPRVIELVRRKPRVIELVRRKLDRTPKLKTITIQGHGVSDEVLAIPDLIEACMQAGVQLVVHGWMHLHPEERKATNQAESA